MPTFRFDATKAAINPAIGFIKLNSDPPSNSFCRTGLAFVPRQQRRSEHAFRGGFGEGAADLIVHPTLFIKRKRFVEQTKEIMVLSFFFIFGFRADGGGRKGAALLQAQ